MSDRMNKGLKPWEPNELGPRHKQMVVLSAAGMKNKDIGELLGMSDSRVSVILNDPRAVKLRERLAAEIVQQLTESAAEVLAGYQVEAAHTMGTLMRHAESENVRRMSAADILDRTGHKAREGGGNQGGIEIDPEIAEALLQGMREARQKPKELTFVKDSAGVFTAEERLFEED